MRPSCIEGSAAGYLNGIRFKVMQKYSSHGRLKRGIGTKHSKPLDKRERSAQNTINSWF